MNNDYQIAVNTDGTINVIGSPNESFDFRKWKEIKSVSAGFYNAAGITYDGDVFVTGLNDTCACITSDWKNVSMVGFTAGVTFGLTKEGNIIHTKPTGHLVDEIIIDEVENWNNIQFISVSPSSIAAIDTKGNVKVVSPLYPNIAKTVEEWRDIRYLSLSTDSIAGIDHNGEVFIALSSDRYSSDDLLKDLRGATKICVDSSYIIGLMLDGTLRVKWFGDEKYYKDDICALDYEQNVIDINSYEGYLVILKKDGSVLAVG